MGTLFKIAWRNVWRHGKRTALTIVTMAFGLGLFIAMDSLLKGMDKAGLANIVNLTDSSVRISTKEYEAERRSYPLEYGIADLLSLEKTIRQDPLVEAVAFRTRFIGQLSNGVDALPVMAVALDPGQDAEVFTLKEHVEGSWFGQAPGSAVGAAGGAVADAADQGRGLVLGKRLAGELGLALGDWITLSARTRYEAQNADDFIVVGLIDSSEPAINSGGVFISFEAAEDFLELEGLRTEAVVRLADRVNLADAMADSDALSARIAAAFPDLEPKSFGEVGRQFLEISKAKSKGTGLIIFVMLLIAGVGIANTVLMSVYSRIREIGVLRAFGFKPKDISRLFLIEGGIIGFLGSMAGVLFGIGLNIYLIYVGYPVDKLLGDADMTGLPIWGTLYGEWNPQAIIGAAVFGILVALFSSRSPAKKAASLEVTQALRFV